MKIALIGYGAMGKLIGNLLIEAGDEISAIIDEKDAGLSAVELAAKLKGADAAIDFSIATAVRRNTEACMLAEVALIEGTTGWNPQKEEIQNVVAQYNGAFVFGANFSIGVNLFYRIADHASALLSKFPEYEPFIEERHHSRKLDAPSGTALKIKDIAGKHFEDGFSISSTRAGNIPGTHTLGFDGPADQVLLTHNARNREGFASGAIMAARWIACRRGFWEFTEVMDEVLKSK